jgi:CubicO group peptidase (beta-lactamase class C family)
MNEKGMAVGGSLCGSGVAERPQIAALLREHVISARVAPAACAGYANLRGGIALAGAGSLPGGVEVTASTVFDLASVSKPIVACALSRLVEQGRLELAAPLGRVLPELAGTRSAPVPLELLLAHRAGLDGHRALFAPVVQGQAFRRGEALRCAANARRPDCVGSPPPQGFPPLYSDLGYVLLGACIEAVTHDPLDRVIEREVAVPLGLELGSARVLHGRRASFARDVAPTEVVRARGGCLRGVVHDENAWALSGHACSGHAGVFGTVRDVLGFGAALLAAHAGTSTWLSRASLELLVRPRPGGTLRAGFDGKSEGGSSAGTLAGPQTFGHLGFTGTSLWCDPGAGIASVLLTNRVYPTRDNPRIRAARPLVHDGLFRAASPLLPGPPNP